MSNEIVAAVQIQLISLKARRKAAAGYVLNSDMQIEVRLLDAQIDALTKLKDDLS